MNEFDREPVPPVALQPGRYFAANFAGEHVAGTEFVIGALFVTWGVGARDVIAGLLIGNLLAVLSWVLICGPIATNTRLTLYAYLEKIAGPGFVKIYSVVNGCLFCILAGAMITVSASAVRILFDVPPQVSWYPTSLAFIAIVLIVGGVVAFAAACGFSFIARFSAVAAPWLISVFFVGAIAVMPVILASSDVVGTPDGPTGLLQLAETSIWVDTGGEMGILHVIALAWGANLAFHGALGDMTILRFARKSWYSAFSVFGMFIGHFGAWLAAGVMGAAAALLLKTDLTALDPGAVAFQSLGAVGILAVIIAGWTTANPTIYRAGLAFQSINPAWSRAQVTLIVGVITTLIAVFPFVFTQLLSFLGIMALIVAPIGGIIVSEHYVLKRIGLHRYWRLASGVTWNVPAVLTWALALLVAGSCYQFLSMHLLFLFVPAWLSAFAFYPLLVRLLQSTQAIAPAAEAIEAKEVVRRRAEEDELAAMRQETRPGKQPADYLLLAAALGALIISFGLGIYAFRTEDMAGYKSGLILTTFIYFGLAVMILVRSLADERRAHGS